MGLRPIFPNMLADLKLPQPCDQPGPQQHRQEHRRDAGHGRPESVVLEDSERRMWVVTEQVFVAEPEEHWSVPSPFVRSQEPFHCELDVNPARSLKQNDVARLCERT